MRTLREQIYEIAKARRMELYSKHVSFSMLVDQLAVHMFRTQETESADTYAVRRALNLFHSPGFVSAEEPEVKS